MVSDNGQGAYQAMSYLIQRGHRHIGLVGGRPDGYPSLRERRQGYIQALKDHGLIFLDHAPAFKRLVRAPRL